MRLCGVTGCYLKCYTCEVMWCYGVLPEVLHLLGYVVLRGVT